MPNVQQYVIETAIKHVKNNNFYMSVVIKAFCGLVAVKFAHKTTRSFVIVLGLGESVRSCVILCSQQHNSSRIVHGAQKSSIRTVKLSVEILVWFAWWWLEVLIEIIYLLHKKNARFPAEKFLLIY